MWAGVLALAMGILAGAVFIGNERENLEQKEAVERADTAMQNFLDVFYVEDESGESGEVVGETFWTSAETFEIAVDAYEKTGQEKYRTLMEQMYHGFIKNYGEEWSGNTYNDDIMWMTIGCARAYELTGESYYKEQAEHHFNLVFERAWSDDLGGGLFWRTDHMCKNACINGPAVIAACLLYRITENADYMEKALMIYNWELDTLYCENGAVYDNIDMEGNYNKWASTYNQGTFIGASHLLYQLTGEDEYLNYAVSAADYTMNEMFHQGVINTEDEGGDLPGFKGILARWLGKLVTEGGQKQYRDWMVLNAQSAWENQNQKGLMCTLWAEKTKDTFYMPWGCSAAIAQQFAVIGM